MEQNSYKERASLFYGDRLFDYNNLGNNYIAFSIKYESYRRNTGIIAGFSTVHDLTP